jgi:hypothetical protein
MRSPRLTTRLLRAIEDALLFRRACPPDLESLPEEETAEALAWATHQLKRRRAAPRAFRPPTTPLEAWLERNR